MKEVKDTLSTWRHEVKEGVDGLWHWSYGLRKRKVDKEGNYLEESAKRVNEVIQEIEKNPENYSRYNKLLVAPWDPTVIWRLVRVPRLGGRRTIIRTSQEDIGIPDHKVLKSSDFARLISRRTIRLGYRVWIVFDTGGFGYQRRSDLPSTRSYHGEDKTIDHSLRGPQLGGAQRTLAVDGISICLVRLTVRLTPLSRRASIDNIRKKEVEYYGAFVAMEGRIRAVFLVTDVLWFYISFEAVLIPIYLRVGTWGSRERKVRAAYRFFRYTIAGSVRMLVAVLYRSQHYGTTDIHRLKRRIEDPNTALDANTARRRWLAFFRALAVKVPIVPVHVWLPEAHVEAPTGGSVILAGIRLKRGTYGIVRRLRGIFADASIYYTPRVYIRAGVGVVYPARTAMRQTDRKRIVAYASVSHMNLTLIGLFSITRQGREGAIMQMISHGRVAGGLFIGIGVRYDRYHTRRRTYLGGRAQRIPRYSRIIRVLTMANIGLPGTSAFVGEWLIFVGIIQTNRPATRVGRSGMVLGAVYSRWRLNRLRYGNRKTTYGGSNAGDINRRELIIFIPILLGTVVRGLQPQRVLDYVHVSCRERREPITALNNSMK